MTRLGRILKTAAGFTMIEVLVVIVIMAIIYTVISLVYGELQKRSRDAKRKADITAIANSYETNYNYSTNQYLSLSKGTSAPGEANYYVLGPDSTGENLINEAFRVCAGMSNHPGGEGAYCDSPSEYCFCRESQSLVALGITPASTPGATATETPTVTPAATETPTPTPDVTTGLAGYWKLDETSGNAADSSGNNNNLTNNNGTTYADGKFGNAANFVAASSQSLSISDAAQTGLEGMAKYTFAAWINLTTASGSNPIITKSGNNGNSSYGFNHNNLSLGVGVTTNGYFGAPCSNNQASTSILSTGVWTHVAITYDGSDFRLYKNGDEQSSGSFPYSASGCTTANTSSDFSLGGGNQNGIFRYINGKIDEARVYNKALTDTEMSYLFSLTSF